MAAAILAFGLYGFGLALFAYAGTYSRFWADDYCYSAWVKHFGLFGALVDWYQTSGNRLSTLLFVALNDLFGQMSIRFVPLVILLGWVLAWIFFLRQVRRWLGWQIRGVWLALLALAQVYFAALLAPDRLQTVYWRMGTFHYTLPILILLVNLGLLADGFSRARQPEIWITLVSGLLGLIAAGLSETFAALQAGFFVLGILLVLIFAHRGQRTYQVRLLIAPLMGTLLMMLVMKLAPANAWRQAVMPPPDNLLLILPYSLRFSADFILYTVRGQWTPFLVYVAVIMTIALLAFPSDSLCFSPRALLIAAAGSLLGMIGLIASSFAPSAYAALSYPAGRALMPGCFILLVGLGSAAACIALALRALLPAPRQEWLTAPALVLLVMLSLYPLRAASVVRRDITQLAPRTARWDIRNQQIIDAVGKGSLEIQVQQVDVVPTLEDIGPDASQWVNACASVYYGVHSITANP